MISRDQTTGATHPIAGSIRFDVVAGLTAAAVVRAQGDGLCDGGRAAGGCRPLYRLRADGHLCPARFLAGAQCQFDDHAGHPGRNPARAGGARWRPGPLVTAAATLAGLVGVILVLAGVLRLGFVANFISTPVLTGFKAGIGLVIVIDQVPKLFGIHIHKEGFLRDILSIVQHLPETSLVTLAVAACHADRADRHGMALAAFAGAAGRRRRRHRGGLAARPAGPRRVHRRPHSAGAARTDPARYHPGQQLLPGALGIALMSFTESIAAGRAFAERDDPPVDANRELRATGAANLGGALLGAMPAGGGTSQTAVVRAAGGRTQKASLVTAGVAAATMLLLAPVLGLLPHATLAAVVIVYSVGLIQPAEFAAIRKVRRMEFRWALIACLGVLVFGTLKGIVVAIIVSLLGLASQEARPNLYVIGRKRGADVLRPLSPGAPGRRDLPGLADPASRGAHLLLQRAPAWGADAGALAEEHQPRVLLLDLSRVPDIEYSALQALIEGERRAHERGFALWLSGLNPGVLEVVRNAGLGRSPGPGPIAV